MNEAKTLQNIIESAGAMLACATAGGELQHAFQLHIDSAKLDEAFAILADMEESINVEILAAWRAESIEVIKS